LSIKSPLLAFLLITVFGVALGTILFELSLTRIFSIILWYDYTFMAISVAFFGLGVGAITVYMSLGKVKIKKEKQADQDKNFVHSRIIQSTITFAVSIPVFLLLVVYFVPPNINFIYLYYLASSVPFFFAGMALALIYIAMPKEISKLYFVDLAGSAMATLMLDPLLQKLGAESTMLMTAVIICSFTLAGALLLIKLNNVKGEPTIVVKLGNRNMSYIVIALFATVGITMINLNSSDDLLEIKPGENKGLHFALSHSDIKQLSTVWNSFSRVDVLQNSSLNLTKDRSLASVLIDADAGTTIPRWNGSISDLQWLRGGMDYLPYDILENNTIGNTLVIGSGGGWDVLHAIAGGSKMVTTVEINPSVVSAVKRFGKSAGNIYDRNDVDLYVDDGRRFISSSNSKYDAIVIRLVDSWAAQLAGGYALSENYLYTLEAFREYFRHLDDYNGLLFMVRWNIELPRLMPLLIESLHQEEVGKGIDQIAKQIIVIEDCRGKCDGTNTIRKISVLVKNSPFNDSELNIVKDKVTESKGRFLTMAGQNIEPGFKNLLFANSSEVNSNKITSVDVTSPNWQRALSGLKSPTDDSPFYFAKELIPKQLVILLETILILSLALTGILIYYSKINKIQKNRHTIFYILFVIFIGFGFIFLEITFIQKFLLLLGTPILALTVILFSILLSTGIGSYLSGRLFPKAPVKAVSISIPILVGMVLLYYFFLQDIIYSSIALEISQRISLSIALLFPVGIVMGFQFPSIIRIAYSPNLTDPNSVQSDKEKNTIVTLLWGVNVIASVLGTITTVISSMTIGFNGNLLIAVGLYLAALCSVVLVRHSQNLPAIREEI